MLQRTLQPELLDSLPPDHPDALHNRRDLRLTNRAMGSHRWIARRIPALLRPRERVLEIGAGTGELGLMLAREGIAVDGLDLWPRPPDWPAERIWHRADLRGFDGYGGYEVFVGNLIFHQFSDEELGKLGRALARTARVIVASEPARQRRSQVLFRAFAPLFRANHVSLHDAHVSIAAGFLGDELPRVLGLRPDIWEIGCTVTTLGNYRMTAVRRT